MGHGHSAPRSGLWWEDFLAPPPASRSRRSGSSFRPRSFCCRPRFASSGSRTWPDPLFASGRGLPLLHGRRARLVEVNLVIDVIHPIDRDDVMLPAGSRIVLGQQDAIGALHVIDRTNMLVVRADYFHMILNVQAFEHVAPPFCGGETNRGAQRFHPAPASSPLTGRLFSCPSPTAFERAITSSLYQPSDATPARLRPVGKRCGTSGASSRPATTIRARATTCLRCSRIPPAASTWGTSAITRWGTSLPATSAQKALASC